MRKLSFPKSRVHLEIRFRVISFSQKHWHKSRVAPSTRICVPYRWCAERRELQETLQFSGKMKWSVSEHNNDRCKGLMIFNRYVHHRLEGKSLELNRLRDGPWQKGCHWIILIVGAVRCTTILSVDNRQGWRQQLVCLHINSDQKPCFQ